MSQNYIFGWHAVLAILKANPSNIKCLYVQEGRKDKRLQEVITLTDRLGVKLQAVPRLKLDEFVEDEANHQGIVVEVKNIAPRTNDLPSIIAHATGPMLFLVLDGVQDPHNLGACLRTANAAKVDAVIVPKDNAVGLTPAVCKVASGAAETTNFIQVTNLARTLEFLKEKNVWIYGATEEATQSLYEVDLKGSCAIVLGAEGSGVRRLTKESCDILFKIPMLGDVPSLNVSVASGVCLFEAVRQRKKF